MTRASPGTSFQPYSAWLMGRRMFGTRVFFGYAAAAATAILAATAKDYHTCESCVDAGFGWSVIKEKCGGFANKNCGIAGSSRARVPDADDLLTLSFDCQGMVGLSFRKGETPPTVARVTHGSWASKQGELRLGMRLHSIGSVTITDQGYEFAIALLRANLATCSREVPLQLSFAPPQVTAPRNGRNQELTAQPSETASGAAKLDVSMAATGQRTPFVDAAAVVLSPVNSHASRWWVLWMWRVAMALICTYAALLLVICCIVNAANRAAIGASDSGTDDESDDDEIRVTKMVRRMIK